MRFPPSTKHAVIRDALHDLASRMLKPGFVPTLDDGELLGEAANRAQDRVDEGADDE